MRATGEVIGGRYRLGRKAGAGAMGVVHQAEDLESGNAVAVKLLLANAGAVGKERFLREAEVLLRLQAPEIVRHLAHGSMGDGTPYLITEWLEGETLEQRILRARLSPLETAEVGRQIATALDVAHRRQVVHRDIKPANIFLVGGSCEQVKTLDFGIAHVLGDGSKLTGSDALMGSPKWLSPEQARAEPVDGRSDLFCLGSVLYACLVGTSPFAARQVADTLIAITHAKFKPLEEAAPGVPPRLACLIESMLQLDRSRRPPDARAVADELSAIRSELMLPYDATQALRVMPSAALPVPAPAPMPLPAATATRPAPISAPRSTSTRTIWVVAGTLGLIAATVVAAIFLLPGIRSARPVPNTSSSSAVSPSSQAQASQVQSVGSASKQPPDDGLQLGDRSNVDPIAAFPVLGKYLLEKAPGSPLFMFSAEGLAGGKVDLTRPESSLTATNTAGQSVQVTIDGVRITDTGRTWPSLPLILPTCTFRSIYDDAVSHGLAPGLPFQLTIGSGNTADRVELMAIGRPGLFDLVPGTCRTRQHQ